MERYQIITSIEDMGPYVSKLILHMPCEVQCAEISEQSFNIYVERRDIVTGEVIVSKSFETGEESICKGYQKALAAYPCDAAGNKKAASNLAAIELAEEALGKRIEGDVLQSRFIDNAYRVTLLHTLGGQPGKSGFVFDECVGEICPQLKGWKQEEPAEEKALKFGYFEPEEVKEAIPLIIWLHGAGEGGSDPKIAYGSNKTCNISSPAFQKYFGGKAWVLVPQCPTVWMDDGVEKLGKSNRSIYVEPVKECIDNFIRQREGLVDRNRIYVGGLSNGGFMTMRLLFDYPDFFAAAILVCEVFYSHNITDEMLESIRHIPVWFAHAKPDELVPPRETSLPTYHRLKAAGAQNVHFPYYLYMQDLSGRYRDAFGRPVRMFNHAVWVHVFNDECHTELDGSAVLAGGEPVSIWEWLGTCNKNDN